MNKFLFFLFITLFQTQVFAESQNISCPMFHCNPEATTVVYKSIIPGIRIKTSNSDLGQLKAQGCSSDGKYISCLYFTDTATGTALGTLKVLDAATMLPIWGSAGALNSYNPMPTNLSPGQVPVFLANQKIAVGDNLKYVRYNLLTGEAEANAIAISGASVMGMTPLTENLGIIFQTNGILTLIDLVNWKKLDQLTLLDPLTKDPISLASPSTGSDKTLYSLAYNKLTNSGFLISVNVDTVNLKLIQKNSTQFQGTAGASPVVIKPSQSGLANNLVLFHAPSSPNLNQDGLLAILDESDSFKVNWKIPLTSSIQVTPTIDELTKSLYFQLNGQNILYKYNYIDGSLIGQYNIQELGLFPSTFKINGHMASSQAGGIYSLLLAGSIPKGQSASGQYILSFSPEGTGKLLWSNKISAKPDVYTAAWGFFTPIGSRIDYVCPIIVGYNNGVTKLCNN